MASKRKYQPAVRYLRYELTNSATPGTETSHFIDLARDLSRVNRRLYRQGRDYHVKKISIVSSNTISGWTVADLSAFPGITEFQQNGGRVTVSTIPDSWPARGAWNRGFNTYKLMNKEATHNLTNDISATWADFKVYMSNDHRTGNALTPLDNGGNAVTGGEWTYSVFISPDGTTSSDTFSIHMLGDSLGSAGAWSSVGLIKSFGETRATVDTDQPNVPGAASDDPLLNVFDYGTTVDEVINQLEADNDNPPYAVADYPGADTNMPKPLVVQQTCITDGKATMGGFNAICGLLELETTSPIANDTYSVLVELAPGKYRGVAAEVI